MTASPTTTTRFPTLSSSCWSGSWASSLTLQLSWAQDPCPAVCTTLVLVLVEDLARWGSRVRRQVRAARPHDHGPLAIAPDGP